MIEKTKVNKLYNILLRILLIAVTYGFIWKKLFVDHDFGKIIDAFATVVGEAGFAAITLIVVILMILNWGIEAFKWRFLISKIEKISFIKSLEAVFTGSSVSFFTPNRIGEYFGRVFILEKASRIEGILITVLGSMSQLLVTILAGTIALILFAPLLLPSLGDNTRILFFTVAGMIILLDVMLVLFYFNISLISGLRKKITSKKFSKSLRVLKVFKKYSFKELSYVFLLSFSRYIVFSLQYFLLLRVFGINVPLFPSLMIISLIFLVITVFPTIALTELGIRGSAALYLFGIWYSSGWILGDSEIAGILSASTFLWLLNLVIPAITGTIFVYRLKFFRKNKKEEIS